MLEHYFRASYQTLFVDPVIHRLPRLLQNKPHVITFGALICGFSILICLALHHPYWATGFLLLSGYLDTLDGSLARLSQGSSPLGAVLDIVVDRAVEAFIVIGLFLWAPEQRALLCLLLLASILVCVTSFLIVSLFSNKEGEKSFYYSPGLVERAEAFLFFIAMMLFPAWFSPIAILFILLLLATTLIRIKQFASIPGRAFD